MCTLIALHRIVPGFPVVVAMNRDEFFDRPSRPPSLAAGPPRIARPSDARAEGTWIGVNEHGVVAALSNRFAGPQDMSARSRGLLCLESLRMSTVQEAGAYVSEQTESHPFNPFHLLHLSSERVVLTAKETTVWASHGDRGLNVLTNDGLNGEDARAVRVRQRLADATYPSLDATVRTVRNALADHEKVGGRSICHHGEETGTRSQTIVAVSDHGWRENRLWYSEGPACEGVLEDFAYLFE